MRLPLPQVALDKAADLMDLVASGATPGGYAAIREALVAQYTAAGLTDAANFIASA